ncbi:DUF4271 domain-containing protein [Wenyingzhuangia sp. IMCC45533]
MNIEIREPYYNNVATALLFLPILFIFFMCLLDLRRSKLFFNTFFSNKYFYAYPVDLSSFVSLYNLFVFGFISTTFSLFLMLILYSDIEVYTLTLNLYVKIFLMVLAYSILKFLGGKLYSYFFRFSNLHKQMLSLETSYLASLLMLVFPLFGYAILQLNHHNFTCNIMVLSVLFLYCFRLGKLIWNNKNLLSGQVLYIILYLCTLEIFPFIYFFKRYTE